LLTSRRNWWNEVSTNERKRQLQDTKAAGRVSSAVSMELSLPSFLGRVPQHQDLGTEDRGICGERVLCNCCLINFWRRAMNYRATHLAGCSVIWVLGRYYADTDAREGGCEGWQLRFVPSFFVIAERIVWWRWRWCAYSMARHHILWDICCGAGVLKVGCRCRRPVAACHLKFKTNPGPPLPRLHLFLSSTTHHTPLMVPITRL
jgi:hypothetical protein